MSNERERESESSSNFLVLILTRLSLRYTAFFFKSILILITIPLVLKTFDVKKSWIILSWKSLSWSQKSSWQQITKKSFVDKGFRPADNYWSDAGIFIRHDPRRTWRHHTLRENYVAPNKQLQRKSNKQMVSFLSPNRPAPSRLAFL